MKCALYTFAAGAACLGKSMGYMTNRWNCQPSSASPNRSKSCWSNDSCGSSERGDFEATTEIRYSVRYPSKEKSQNVPISDPSSTIVDAAMADSRFETLALALQAAGLVETLQQEGPFTVFAPTNDAFARLPEGALEDLLKPENKKKLASILTYHVVAGEFMAEDIESSRIETVNGLKASVKVTAAGTKVDNAEVVETDLLVGNGVIHVIDEVILPPSID